MHKIKTRGWKSWIPGLLLLFLLSGIAGCGTLQNSREIEAGIKKAFPDAVILQAKSGKDQNGYRFKEFTIDNKGVVFTYKNYQKDAFFFSGTVADSTNDYSERLLNFFSEKIEEITKKYLVQVEEIGSSIQMENHITDMQQIDTGAQAFQEIYLLLQDHLPQVKLDWFDFQLNFRTFYDNNQKQLISVEKQGDWDYSYARNLLYLNFKADVDMGLVSNVKLSNELLDSIPQKYIRALYINGNPYQSEAYEIEFLYNLEDERYYALVGFGIEIEYNGGVKDYLQREIIESYYPDADYSISTKDQTSSYQIGDDHYLITRQKNGLKFFKNSQELKIKSYSQLSGTSTGATYYYWISVDDFAALMGMSVDSVQKDGVYLFV